MMGTAYYTRLAAALITAAMLGAIIFKPNAGRQAMERALEVASAVEKAPLATRACAIGEPAFAGPFADINDVLSISPLGGVTAPGEVLPAPYLRINTKQGESAFQRRMTTALAPAKADIVAIERKIERDEYGRARAHSWAVYFRSCEDIAFTYDRLDRIDETLLARAGGLGAFVELGGPDRIALETKLRVNVGDAIGQANGFDVALHDLAARPTALERPERYASNPFARAAVFDAPPSLLKVINPDASYARCAIDYLPTAMRDEWAAKLGDSWGIRRAKGENACRTALLDKPGAAQGVWYSDAAHNAATTKVSAIALAGDAIDPDRQIFALHGRLVSLSPSMIALAPKMDQERAAATKEFLTFAKANSDSRINTPFDAVNGEAMHCYERLRVNFIGPLVTGVILLKREGDEGQGVLKMEARADALTCADLSQPWAFTGNETVFYR